MYLFKDVYFYPGTENVTDIMMTGVKCEGDEVALQYCQHDGKHLSPCGESGRTLTPFAGAICTESKWTFRIMCEGNDDHPCQT